MTFVRARLRLSLIIALSLMVLVLPGSAQSSQWSKFDGHWWLATSNYEHEGFLSGFLLCYYEDYKKPLHSTWRYSEIDSMVEQYLARDSTHLGSPMWSVLPRVMRAAGAGPYDAVDKGGEQTEEDADFWLQYVQDEDGQARGKGYIEGYLACNENLLHGRRGKYKKSAEEYVALIVQWYGYDPKTYAFRVPSREDVLVKDVLFKLRDSTK